MSFQSLLTNTGKSMIPTLVVDQFGGMTGHTSQEQELYTKLIRLSKQYPVIVNLSGTKLNRALLHSMTLDHLEVYDLVVPVPRAHVMVTLSSQLWSGSTRWTIDKIDVFDGSIDKIE